MRRPDKRAPVTTNGNPAPEHIPFGERAGCSVTDAVLVSGLSRSTLYQLMKEKKLEFRKFGTRTVVVVASLMKLVAGDKS
jgi:hypothetical protein